MTDLVEIRNARRQDRAALLRMWVDLVEYHRGLDAALPVPAELERGLRQQIDRGTELASHQLQVAETGPGLIGFSLSEAVPLPSGKSGVPADGWIHELWVAPAWRRGGLGSRLVAGALSFLRANGVERISVRVEALNRPGLDFWRGRGFAERARILERDASP
ncbi:MAG: GNAT family N-acetyltransferase [Proteobacteria bacterium]|nr:GNAT family N-acetyltransferase [Pseudomonadota bacterium]